TPLPFCLMAIAAVVRLGSGGVILLAQRLLVDLTDAGFRQLLHEKDLVRYAVFRDYALVGIAPHMNGRRAAQQRDELAPDFKAERPVGPHDGLLRRNLPAELRSASPSMKAAGARHCLDPKWKQSISRTGHTALRDR